MKPRDLVLPSLFLILSALVLLTCSMENDEPSFSNPFDPAEGGDIPAPDSIRVSVGDGYVRLAWGLPAGIDADRFAVFRRTRDGETDTDERLLARVTAREYVDTAVRNDKVYVYRLASGLGGRFGPRTEEIVCRPGLFSILLADGKRLTKVRAISVTFQAPGAQAVRLYEAPDSAEAPWQPASGPATWTLSAGDGRKTVYAQFRFPDGSTSLPAGDWIRLDTAASIESVSFDGAAVRRPGETIHFRIVTEETNGSASIRVDGIFASVALLDDGTRGDRTAADGTYEGDLVLPPSSAASDKEVVGSFTDEAGNAASSVSAPLLLTVWKGPDPVTLLPPEASEPPEPASVNLRWSGSLATEFSAYRVFRSEAAPVDSTDRLIQTIRDVNTIEYRDSDVIEGFTYHYRVYVQDDRGVEAGSNPVELTLANSRPPAAVNLETPNSVSESGIALAWGRSADRDFRSYRIYRNSTGAVSDADTLLARITDADRTFLDDSGLRENTLYYYRVYVDDAGGLFSRSNEVEARTGNAAPPPVQLNEATGVDSAGATLSWSESPVHDFKFYRAYRDTIAAVTTASRQIAEMDNRTFTSYRDSDVSRATTYYYRIFVFDDATDPKSTGSNTVTVAIP